MSDPNSPSSAAEPNQSDASPSNARNIAATRKPIASARLGWSEDWTAAVVGLSVLVLALIGSLLTKPDGLSWSTTADSTAEPVAWASPLKDSIGKPGKWGASPVDAFRAKPTATAETGAKPKGAFEFTGLAGAFVATVLIGLFAMVLQGAPASRFLAAFPMLFVLAVLAYLLAGQEVVSKYNLSYALWALLVGLIISNTVGTPAWLRPAVRGEMYIKVGLVLLGVEVLFGRLLALGLPGIFVSWVVTPIVLISTYLFGQKILKISSKSLNMTISADMCVCGVSAAIATAAACKAKKEELSLAVGLSLCFTVFMMVAMPPLVLALGLDPLVGGAWMGGTIDSTGAVAAAGAAYGAALGEAGAIATETAVTVKMIQNILIGVIAFGVAVYWTRWVESSRDGSDDGLQPNIGVGEIWKRFPKFVLGFIGASLICSMIFAASYFGELWVESVTKGVTKPLRGWMFCLAFTCIGLETNFRELLPYFRSGKPLLLYLCGQGLNVLLTFLMAYLMFGVLADWWGEL